MFLRKTTPSVCSSGKWNYYMEIFSKAPLCLDAPCACFFPLGKNNKFWNLAICLYWKSSLFLKFDDFSKNGCPGQTTMPIWFVSKFCAEPRSPFSYICHRYFETLWMPLMKTIFSILKCLSARPQNLGKTFNNSFWPESQLQFSSDGGDDVVPPTLPSRLCLDP